MVSSLISLKLEIGTNFYMQLKSNFTLGSCPDRENDSLLVFLCFWFSLSLLLNSRVCLHQNLLIGTVEGESLVRAKIKYALSGSVVELWEHCRVMCNLLQCLAACCSRSAGARLVSQNSRTMIWFATWQLENVGWFAKCTHLLYV